MQSIDVIVLDRLPRFCGTQKGTFFAQKYVPMATCSTVKTNFPIDILIALFVFMHKTLRDGKTKKLQQALVAGP